MERVDFKSPEEKYIVSRKEFFINELVPLIIKPMKQNIFGILFKGTQDVTENSLYFNSMIVSQDEDEDAMLNNCLLSMNSISKNAERSNMYKDITKDMRPNNMYNCGFNMTECEDKRKYFTCKAYRNTTSMIETPIPMVEELTLYVPREVWVQLNLFYLRLNELAPTPEMVFIDPTLKQVEFIDINHIKLNATWSEIGSKVVMCNYTIGRGPTQFSFNYMAPRLDAEKKVRNIVNKDVYASFYSNDPMIGDIIYDPHGDKVYLIYIRIDPVTDKYKDTKILRLSKEFYERSNFVDYNKIYEE